MPIFRISSEPRQYNVAKNLIESLTIKKNSFFDDHAKTILDK